jgi:hypothetical protein
MHKKNTQRWSKLISTAGILAVLFGGLFAQSVRAVISNPTPICVGSTCTVTFDATNDYYLWSPPAGAKNITFDLMGAQGGRSGGLGGRVTGTLATTPTALYIYVGGAGQSGSGVAGGFNGGGTAGGGRGDEGSGGGATDIRTSATVNDRIAVAAGGGGSGGFGGGQGGAAGGLTGSNGVNGQGQGGFGASQSSGGSGGSPNGGTAGASGALAVGGTGGSSSTSGGGGGGGGYYGGGGGGADLDACCTNGGGGGGGSSWTHATAVTSPVHTAGYRSGNGVAIISYALPPTVSSFTPSATLTNATSIGYTLVFSESVTGLANTDFATTGSTATCTAIAVSGTAANYLVTASGCSPGTYKLTLLANSVTGAVAGPSADSISTDVVIDRTIPTVTATSPSSPTALETLEYGFTFSKTVTGLATTDFTVTGTSCEVTRVTGSAARYSVEVTRCNDGVTTALTLTANSVSDAAGNLGPASALSLAAVLINRGTIPAPTPTPTSAPAPSSTPTPSVVAAPPAAGGGSGGGSGGSPSGNGGSTGGATPGVETQPAPTVNSNPGSLQMVAPQPVRKTYAFTSAIKLPTSPEEEPIAIYEPDAPQITVDNPADDPPIKASSDWQQYAMIGVGSLSGLLATIGIAKAARQMRNRRLVKKFA